MSIYVNQDCDHSFAYEEKILASGKVNSSEGFLEGAPLCSSLR